MTDTRSPWERIRDTLRHRLLSGQATPGSRFYSNNSLAQTFGVSAPTAGKILDDLCAAGLVERKRGSGTYVTAAARPAGIATYVVVAWIEAANPQAYKILRYDMITGFERVVANRGLRADFLNLDDADHQERLTALLEAGLDGAFVLPRYDDPRMVAVIERLRAAGVAVVHWHREDEPNAATAFIQFDNHQCGRMAAAHLLDLGHTEIAAVTLAPACGWAQQRVAGCRAALAAAGLDLPESRVRYVAANELTPSLLAGELRRLLAGGCTAIVAGNDALAMELILAGRAVGYHCPNDFSITGVDNREEALCMGLTTLDTPGAAAAEAAFALLRDPTMTASRHQIIPCTLVIRRSTAPVAIATERTG